MNLQYPHRSRSVRLFALISSVFLSACATISPFNQVAYEHATSLKVEALDMMSLATEPFPAHYEEARQIMLDAKKALEYAKGRPHNEDSARQWTIMIDSNTALLGGFIARWQKENTLKPAIIEGAQKNVADGFDEIIGLESGKLKAPNTKSE